MPSSPKVSKERMLQAALDILIRDGYQAVNIKRVAQAIGCSTQPISWQFGGMEGFRAALAEAAEAYVEQLLLVPADNAVAAFAKEGEAYVDLAIDRPNLFRFLYLGESGRGVEGGFMSLMARENNQRLQSELAQTLQIPPQDAGAFMRAMVIYTHGIASLIVAGVVGEERDTAHQMVRQTGITMLQGIGVARQRAEAFLAR